jgi:hypothetical protein
MAPMTEVCFVLAERQNAFFVELAEALVAEIEALGGRARIARDEFPEPEAGLAYALLPPHEYFALSPRDLRPRPELLARTVFISAEQPGTDFFESNIALAPSAGAVFDINGRAVREYGRRGISAEHLILGYTPSWDHFDADSEAGAEREIDLLFLGCYSKRRARYLASYADAFSEMRCRLVVSDNSLPNPGSSGNFLHGDEKWQALRDSRLLLNLHQGSHSYFEWHRVLQAIHCGCVVVTEPSTDHAPLVPGVHFLTGRPGSLHLLAAKLVEEDAPWRAMREAAYEKIRDELPLRTSAERLLAVAEEISRAPLATRESTAEMVAGIGDPLPERHDYVPQDLTSDPDASILRRALKRSRLDTIDQRRTLARIEATLLRGSAPPPVEIAAETAAYAAATPRVSVLTALYNHSGYVLEALDSLAESTFRDFELLIVEDGSTDDSLDQVRDWLRAHGQLPVRLLRHPVNLGLPRARNAALDFARGEFAFILDSDNTIYPRCIGRLVEALDADSGAEFAFGMMQRFWDDGSLDLINHFAWEPVRLRDSNFIDAMALLRVDALRELGGFTCERDLYGWEDYDLWCRFAELGRYGVHVKEILARYRASETSMLSLTKLSHTDAYAKLINRHPRLMAGLKPPL